MRGGSGVFLGSTKNPVTQMTPWGGAAGQYLLQWMSEVAFTGDAQTAANVLPGELEGIGILLSADSEVVPLFRFMQLAADQAAKHWPCTGHMCGHLDTLSCPD